MANQNKILFYSLMSLLLILIIMLSGCPNVTSPVEADASSIAGNLIDMGDYYIYDGDILLAKSDETHKKMIASILNSQDSSKGLISVNENIFSSLWKTDKVNGKWEVPFYFNGNFTSTEKANIWRAMHALEAVCNVKFVSYTGGFHILKEIFDIYKKPAGTNPSAYIGRVFLLAAMNLPPDCPVGSIVHELGHVLGLGHEQQRNDRNSYVTVNSNDNTNFGIHSSGVKPTEYDFESIMHYGFSSSMSINPAYSRYAYIARQRAYLSDNDIDTLQYAYGKPSGYTDITPNKTLQVRIRNKAYNRYIDIADESTDARADVTTTGWLNRSSQKFYMVNNGVYYNIFNVYSKLALDVENNDTTTGANLIQFPCATWANNQKWEFIPDQSGYYRIQGVSSQLYLESNSNDLRQYSYRTSSFNSQLWQIEPIGTVRIVNNATNKVIAVQSGSKDYGAKIIEYTWYNSDSEKWFFSSLGDGTCKIFSINSNQCLDVPGGSSADNVQLCQWISHDGDNQKWILEIQADGTFKIKNTRSQKYLDVYGGMLIQKTASASASQKWRIEGLYYTF